MEVASEGRNLMEKVMHPYVQEKKILIRFQDAEKCIKIDPTFSKGYSRKIATSGMRDPAIQNILTDPVLRRGIRQSSCVLHKTNKFFQGRHIGNKRDVKVAIKTILEVDLIEVKGDRSKSVLFNAGRVAKGLRHLDEKYCKETWEILSSVVVM
ncbi:hypothetical protein YC2023_105373 [Brassica napus]